MLFSLKLDWKALPTINGVKQFDPNLKLNKVRENKSWANNRDVLKK